MYENHALREIVKRNDAMKKNKKEIPYASKGPC